MSNAALTGWHFLREDKRLQFEPHTLVEVGQTLEISERPACCVRGFHASKRAIDALNYAPGPVVCWVELGGEIVEQDDKAAAQKRTVIAMADATTLLREFACWCAENALRTAKVEDARCWAAIETKRKWLKGEASDADLAAAWAAAGAAAWDAAWAAARDAAWDAARDAAGAAAWDAAGAAAWDAAWAAARAAAGAAARDAARDAAWAAARDAAWDAARDAARAAARVADRVAQNNYLETKLRELLKIEADAPTPESAGL